MAAVCPLLTTHLAQGIPPVADVFSGSGAYSDIVDASLAEWVEFIVQKGVGTTGTSTFTVEACDDTSASNVTAIPFWYMRAATADTFGSLTAATSTGYLNTAGSNHIERIAVDTKQVALTGYRYVRLKSAEGTDSPVLAGVLVQLHGLRNRPNVGSAVP